MMRFTRLLLLPALCAVPCMAWAQSEVSPTEVYLNDLASMEESGAGIERMLHSDATKALVLEGGPSRQAVTAFLQRPGLRLAKAAAIFALGETRDPERRQTLKGLLEKLEDPFLRAAADAAVEKIDWWKSDTPRNPGISAESPQPSGDDVSEVWKNAMQSRVEFSRAERIQLVQGARVHTYVSGMGSTPLGLREYAVLSENWDLSRNVVLEKLSNADENDPLFSHEIVTELAVIAMRPIEELQSDAGLLTILRRFMSSSRPSNRILALYGLARVADPQAMAAIAGFEPGRSRAELFQSLAEGRRQTKFADLYDTYSETCEWEMAFGSEPGGPAPADSELSMPPGGRETADIGGTAGSTGRSSQRTGTGTLSSPDGRRQVDPPRLGAGDPSRPDKAPPSTDRSTFPWMVLGFVAAVILVAALVAMQRGRITPA